MRIGILLKILQRRAPFYLLYGRDARLPSQSVLNQQPSPYAVDVTDYKTEFVSNLTNSWKLAKENITVSQSRQKKQHDKHARQHQFKTGDRIMIYMPSAVTGKAWKLARPYHGPYRTRIECNPGPTNVEAGIVDDPDAETIFVAVNKVTPCYPEQTNTLWKGQRKRKSGTVSKPTLSKTTKSKSQSSPTRTTGPVTRSMTRAHDQPND